MQFGKIYSEGYMGATNVDGVNCGMFGYDRKKMHSYIKDEFKKESKFKGITYTVKNRTFGIEVNINVKDTDILTYDEFVNNMKDYCLNKENLNDTTSPEYLLMRRISRNGIAEYPGEIHCTLSNSFRGSSEYHSEAQWYLEAMYKLLDYAKQNREDNNIHKVFVTQKYQEAAEWLDKAYESFSYDHSNTMVDYFDRSWGYTINLKYKPPRKTKSKIKA